jgi:hypothetical protein
LVFIKVPVLQGNVSNVLVAQFSITNFIRGNKFFELSNHLGHVWHTMKNCVIKVWFVGIRVLYQIREMEELNFSNY